MSEVSSNYSFLIDSQDSDHNKYLSFIIVIVLARRKGMLRRRPRANLRAKRTKNRIKVKAVKRTRKAYLIKTQNPYKTRTKDRHSAKTLSRFKRKSSYSKYKIYSNN